MNVTELADNCQISQSTIVRFCQSIGLKGFYHLKITLAKEINVSENSPSPIVELDDVGASIYNILSYKIKELEQTVNFLDEKVVESCIKLISQSNIVHFVAAGNSFPVALDGAYKFNQIGVRSVVNTSPEMQISFAHSLTDQDVVIGISNSGDSKLLLHVFDIAKEKGATTICITNHMKSPLSQKANYQLNTATNEKIFFSDFSYTRLPAIAVIDILFLLLSKISEERSIKSIGEREQTLSGYKY